MFFGNILASAYRVYGKFEKGDPYFRAVCYAWVCQMVIIFLAVAILEKTTAINLFSYLPGKYFDYLFFIIWMVLFFKYFSTKKVENIVVEFEKKPKWQRIVWGWIAVLTFVTSLIAIISLGTKSSVIG